MDCREVGEQRAHRLRQRLESHRDIERDSEAPFGADERAEQIVALHLSVRIAQRDDLSAGQQCRDREHVVERDPVLETVGPARVFGYVAADGARRLARRVGRVVQPVRRRGARQAEVHDARLDDRAAVLGIDRDDVAQAMEAEQHDVVGERTTREPRARTARHVAHAALGEHPHDGDRLVACAWKHGERRALLVARQPIGLVRPQLTGSFEHAALTDDRGERAGEPIIGARRTAHGNR